MKPSTLLSLFALLTVPFSIIFKGHVFRCLWDWFAVPFGLPHIGIAQGIGIMLVLGFATWQWRYQREAKDDDEEVKRLVHAFVVSWIYPSFTLLMGWVVMKFL